VKCRGVERPEHRMKKERAGRDKREKKKKKIKSHQLASPSYSLSISSPLGVYPKPLHTHQQGRNVQEYVYFHTPSRDWDVMAVEPVLSARGVILWL
jgi:hypothetical protein